VDLGAERGKPGEEKNKFMLIVRPVTTIRMEALRSYLTGKASWTESVLECMSKWTLRCCGYVAVSDSFPRLP